MAWLPENATHYVLDRLRAPMTGLINVLSVAFAVYGTLAAIYVGQLPDKDKVDKANLLLVILVIGLVAWMFFREFYLARKQRYANASHNTYHLAHKFNELNQYLLDKLKRATRGELVSVKEVRRTFASSLQGVCDETVRLFSSLQARIVAQPLKYRHSIVPIRTSTGLSQ